MTQIAARRYCEGLGYGAIAERLNADLDRYPPPPRSVARFGRGGRGGSTRTSSRRCCAPGDGQGRGRDPGAPQPLNAAREQLDAEARSRKLLETKPDLLSRMRNFFGWARVSNPAQDETLADYSKRLK